MPRLARQLHLLALLLAICFSLPAKVEANGPAPGVRITNQARVNYLNPETFLSVDLYSNEVAVTVTGVDGVEIHQDQTATVGPGETVAFRHEIRNTGNRPGSFSVFAEQLPGNDFQLENILITIDLNRNGHADSSEPAYANPFPLTIPAGTMTPVILSGRTPVSLDEPQPVAPMKAASAPAAPSAQLRIHAFIAGTDAAAANTDTVLLESGRLQIFKSVDRATAAPGDAVTYTLTGSNSGLTDLAPVHVRVDGRLEPVVLIRDPIPPNLTFVEAPRVNGALLLYHTAGENTHHYTTTPPPDLARVDAIAWGFSRMQPSQHFVVSFTARLGPAATGTTTNIAYAYTALGGVSQSTPSNIANFSVPQAAPEIDYYQDNTFAKITPATELGNDLWVQATAGACNLSTSQAETVSIIITSALTGDREVFPGSETGINTGIFQILQGVPTENATGRSAVPGDGILQSLPRDELTAEITGCGGVSTSTRIIVGSMGIVFDSRTGDPLAGATVRLIDVTGQGNGGNPGQSARVLTGDGSRTLPATQITGPDGSFRYPMVNGDRFLIEVIPPANYTFPSTRPQGMLPPGRLIEFDGSYGRRFTLQTSPSTILLDIPLDPTLGTGFGLEKEVSQEWVEVGESVIYTLRLQNSSGATLNAVTIEDELPTGFRYESGSTRRDSVPAADPARSGSQLRFAVGNLADGETATFTYRVRVEANAHHGDGINRAQAISMGPPILRSNQAQAEVRLSAGVFDERGIGRVFVDLDDNGLKTEGEPGVPGVRLVLEDGTWVITDEDGLYSLYGQRPITHMLKVDESTLPPGSLLSAFSPRHALDGASRFIDLKRGELHKANFALIYPTPETLDAVRARREQAKEYRPEIESSLLPTLTPDGQRTLLYDVQGREASGMIGNGQMPRHFESVLPPDTLTAGNSNLPTAPVAAVPTIDLETAMRAIDDSTVGFLRLKDGDILAGRQATIRIKGHPEATLKLTVNGEEAPETRIGKTVRQAEPPLQGIEYIALNLQPGPNELTATEFDPWGNARGSRTITVVAPDAPAQFRIEFSTLQPVADGRTPVEVSVFLEDKSGVSVTSRTLVTLEADLGHWDVADVDARADGLQVFLEDGHGTFKLLPPLEAGLARVRASSGKIQTERNLSFLPALRPMIISGILEGRLNLNGSDSALALGPNDAFQEELRELSGSDDTSATGRGAFYLKGKIKGDALLTIAYDSAKEEDELELFRDIDPDEFYPVYGDSSIRGYDAQSTGKLYVRIDKDRSHLLIGDFNTRSDTDVRELGNYNRSFNGVMGHWENSILSANVWASDASTRQVIREIRANGTSGPFFFNEGLAAQNSEVVEIITRDRNQPSIVLDVEQLSRFSGYSFEPFTGRLLLRRPVPSYDSNLNPQFIRITYEVEEFGEKFWVYGGDAQVKLTDKIEIGASAVEDENPFEPYSLQSANATVEVLDNTYLITEIARSDSFDQGEGMARRAEIRHQSGATEARVFYGESDDSFDNPNSLLSSGRDEGGAKITHQLDDRNRVIVEGVYTQDEISSMSRQGIRTDFEHTLPNRVKVTVGGRVSEEDLGSAGSPDEGPNDVQSARIRVDTPVPHVPSMTVFGEYEQDLRYSDNRILAAGGDVQVGQRTRFYGRHEFLSSLGGRFDISRGFETNRTLIGVESEYMEGGQIFNEYRVSDVLNGRRAEASTGLRNGWNVAPGLRLNTTIERVTPFDEDTSNESTAATAAVEYTANPDWKGTARVETRFADSSDSVLSTLGVARRLNANWTGLARTVFYHQANGSEDSNDVVQARFLGGLAWRQRELDRWNGLFRYEYRTEDGSPRFDPPDLQRDVHIFSASANFQPSRRWIFSGRYATKFVREDFGFGENSDYNAHLLSGRALLELNEHWDLGLNTSVLISGNVNNVHYAIGPEIGYAFHRNMRVGLGYNIVGFRDRDFEDDSDEGLFLTFRLKFDEEILNWVEWKPAEPRREFR